MEGPAKVGKSAGPLPDRGQRRSADSACPRRQQAFVVLNPVAGTTSPDQVRAALATVFQSHGWDLRCYATTGADDFPALIDQALEQGADIVVAAGGDGTVAEVAGALVGKGVPLGIIPLGTGNVLSMELGIPRAIPDAARLLVGEHETCELDAMQVDDRYFFLQVGVGLDSLMIRDTDRASKRKIGRLAYMLTLLRQLIGYQAKRLCLDVDGQRYRVRAWDALVANAGTVGLPIFHWSPDICLTDGKLDLVVLKFREPFDLVRLVWRLLLGLPESRPPVAIVPVTREVTIASSRLLPVQADGEIIGTTPVSVRVVPRAISVVVPEGCLAKSCATRRREEEGRQRAHRLQRTLDRCLGPIGVVDTSTALFFNALPHPPILTLFIQGLADAMNRGDGFLVWLVAATLASPWRGWRALREVAPALWLTDFTVEFPIKRIFQRDRPFQAEVLAPVIGRKPGTHSFPSGHTAAAFGGAWLLSRHFPRWSPLFYGIALLVGFSRLYLGVHYLSDVLAGAVAGVTFAAIYRRLVRVAICIGTR